MGGKADNDRLRSLANDTLGGLPIPQTPRPTFFDQKKSGGKN